MISIDSSTYLHAPCDCRSTMNRGERAFVGHGLDGRRLRVGPLASRSDIEAAVSLSSPTSDQPVAARHDVNMMGEIDPSRHRNQQPSQLCPVRAHVVKHAEFLSTTKLSLTPGTKVERTLPLASRAARPKVRLARE